MSSRGRAPIGVFTVLYWAAGALVVGALVVGIVAAAVRHQPQPEDTMPLTTSGTVDYVVDGDTLRLTTGEYVRLLGIDAPEAEAQDGTGAQCHAAQAAGALQALTPPGAQVTLTRDQTQDAVDRYGRMLAYVAAPDVPDVAAQLLRQGDVRTFIWDDPPARSAAYALAQAEAIEAGAGVWGCPGP